MAQWNIGPKNGLWKGGRSVASNGYVLVRVGTEHHLADVRGYAYEHRVVAEEKIGRRLLAGEVVHHINGQRTDNRADNLEVCTSAAEHRGHHRARQDLRRHDEVNPDIPCACGCGATLKKFDSSGRPRRFLSGHNTAARNAVDATRRRVA
jgi:hypothetical protein